MYRAGPPSVWHFFEALRRFQCFHRTGSRRFSIRYETGADPRSRTATRNASNLLVGSEIRANTRSRNTSSPPAASSSKPYLSYARHNASHRSPPVTTRSPTAPAAATCPGRGPARPARQPAPAAPRSSAPPARRGHARTPDARSGATHAARSARICTEFVGPSQPRSTTTLRPQYDRNDPPYPTVASNAYSLIWQGSFALLYIAQLR